MKINKTIIALSVLAVALTSCGSSQKESGTKPEGPIVIRPATTVIKGDLQEYFTVLDKGYTVKQTRAQDYDGQPVYSTAITVDVVRTDAAFPCDKNKIGSVCDYGSESIKYTAGFGIEFLDSLDNTIGVVYATERNIDSRKSPAPIGEELMAAISSRGGESTALTFTYRSKDKIEKPYKFRLLSILRPTGSEEESTSEEIENNSESVDDVVSQAEDAL